MLQGVVLKASASALQLAVVYLSQSHSGLVLISLSDVLYAFDEVFK